MRVACDYTDYYAMVFLCGFPVLCVSCAVSVLVLSCVRVCIFAVVVVVNASLRPSAEFFRLVPGAVSLP